MKQELLDKFFWLLVLFLLVWITVLVHAKEITKVMPSPTKIERIVPKGKGHWVMAADGHAVYCFGPTVRLGGMLGNMEQYATKCAGKAQTVKLHE